jgi:hypothetical protein
MPTDKYRWASRGRRAVASGDRVGTVCGTWRAVVQSSWPERRGSAGVLAFADLGDEVPDGEASFPLRQVQGRQVIAAVPWRKTRSAHGQAHYPGYFWSATTGGHVIYESRLELRACSPRRPGQPTEGYPLSGSRGRMGSSASRAGGVRRR